MALPEHSRSNWVPKTSWKLLEQTESEEKQAHEKLTEIATALYEVEEEAEDEETAAAESTASPARRKAAR